LLSPATSSDAGAGYDEALFGFVAEFSGAVEACGLFYADNGAFLCGQWSVAFAIRLVSAA